MLSILLGVGLGILAVFGALELAALVGRLGRIADALEAQNAHYGITKVSGTVAYVAPPETSDTGKDAL